MAYYDRHYYGDQPRNQLRAPKLEPISKYVMLGLIAVYVVLFVVVQNSEVVLGSVSDNLWPSALVLHQHALLPVNDLWPAPWQILTATVIHNGVFELVFVCIFLWLFGSLVERGLGAKRYIMLIASSAVIGNIFAALVDPRIAPEGALSFGLSPSVSAALLIAMAQLYPKSRSFLGLKASLIAYIFLGITALLALNTYFLPPAEGGVPMIKSMPALIGAGTWSFFYCQLQLNRGLKVEQNGERNEAEDYESFAKRFDHERVPATVGGEEELEAQEDTRETKRREKVRQRQAADEASVDALLERISKEGISSLTRSERAFLERVSRNKRGGK